MKKKKLSNGSAFVAYLNKISTVFVGHSCIILNFVDCDEKQSNVKNNTRINKIFGDPNYVKQVSYAICNRSAVLIGIRHLQWHMYYLYCIVENIYSRSRGLLCCAFQLIVWWRMRWILRASSPCSTQCITLHTNNRYRYT